MEWVKTSKLRAFLDARVCLLFALMKVWNNFEVGSPNLFVLKSGGLFTASSENCGRQELHTDYLVDAGSEEEVEEKCVGSIRMGTGDDEGELWVYEGSHCSIRKAGEYRMWTVEMRVKWIW